MQTTRDQSPDKPDPQPYLGSLAWFRAIALVPAAIGLIVATVTHFVFAQFSDLPLDTVDRIGAVASVTLAAIAVGLGAYHRLKSR